MTASDRSFMLRKGGIDEGEVNTTDFMFNHKQSVKISQSLSSSLPVGSDVIQGSVLGPNLFNIHVNHIDKSLEHCKILKYMEFQMILIFY